MGTPDLERLTLRRDLAVVGQHDASFSRHARVGEDLTVEGQVIAGPDSAGSNLHTPRDHNMISWTLDPTVATAGGAMTLGTVYLSKLLLRKRATLRTLYWGISVGATTPTAAQCWLGLYSPAGARLATSDISGAGITGTGLFSIGVGPVVCEPPFVWVGMVINAAAAPQFVKNGITGFPGGHNLGLAAASYRFAINGTLATELPASVTPASNTQSGLAWWFAAA